MQSSYRQILRSSSIIGGASLLNIAGGLIRQKAAALIVGAVGVGLVGLLQSFITTAAAIVGLGLASAGTRQIAEAVGREDQLGIDNARRALFWGTTALALAGGSLLWLFRGALARWALGDAALEDEVKWMAVAVALSVAGSAQVALLTGLRRIGDVARVSVVSTLLSSIIGVAALALFGFAGVPLFVMALPLATFVTAHFYTSRLPPVKPSRTEWGTIVADWRAMVPLGTALMAGGVAGLVGQLVVRVLLQRSVGFDELGQYQAAATLSLTYLGFVLSAMGVDYYPRLTASMSQPPQANRLVNEQTEVALILGGPVLLVMLGWSPWVLELLYSSAFRPAAEVLRWQIIADVVKIASWPLGFLLLASGDGRRFFGTELLSAVVAVAATWLLLPRFGTVAAGLAVLVAYASYLPAVYLIARRKTGFAWSPRVLRIFLLLVLLSVVVFGSTTVGPWWGECTGLVAATIFGVMGLATLRKVIVGRFAGAR